MPYKDKKKMAEYMRDRRAAMQVNGIRVNRVNRVNARKPVNPKPTLRKSQYVVSYSRNKYQYVLYRVEDGGETLVGNISKDQEVDFGNLVIRFTWRPDDASIERITVGEAKKRIELPWTR
jgi:hypothetical protein